jgi:hypothetical protein
VGEEGRIGRAKGTIWESVIKPKGSRRAIPNSNTSDRSVSIKFFINNSPEEAMRPVDGSIKGCRIQKQPVFTGHRLAREKLVNELHEKTSVLKLKVFYPEATILFPGLNVIPSN